MQALVQVHLRNHNLSAREMFRVAYMWAFRSDITDMALTNDSKLYEEQGTIPAYVRRYFLHIYGASSCK